METNGSSSVKVQALIEQLQIVCHLSNKPIFLIRPLKSFVLDIITETEELFHMQKKCIHSCESTAVMPAMNLLRRAFLFPNSPAVI